MKKLFTLAVIATSFTTLAATTATLNLNGTVDQVVAIDIDGGASATKTLNITDDAEATVTGEAVGTVNVESNSESGFSVSVTSANSGKLVHADGDTFDYTLNTGNLTSDGASASGVFSQAYPITVDYTQVKDATLASGSYTDSVTFEITAI